MKKTNKKKSIKKKSIIERPRNDGTMTEAAFWAFIKQLLRKGSRFWKPILKVKQKVKRPYKGKNKRQKFEYCCANCKGWFPDKEIQVDHIIPVGRLKNGDDLKGVVERLFVEECGLSPLCITCHSKKTAKDLIKIRKNN